MNKRELGEAYFKEGYNCSQAVVLAFQEEMGIDKDTAVRIASAFGGGMGRMREVCGAVSGMFMVLGALKGYADAEDNGAKKALYADVQALAARFRERSGSIICRELLGLPSGESDPTPDTRTASYYKKRPCASLVGDACEFLEEYLKGN